MRRRGLKSLQVMAALDQSSSELLSPATRASISGFFRNGQLPPAADQKMRRRNGSVAFMIRRFLVSLVKTGVVMISVVGVPFLSWRLVRLSLKAGHAVLVRMLASQHRMRILAGNCAEDSKAASASDADETAHGANDQKGELVTIESMPPEILAHICESLTSLDVSSLAMSSRTLHEHCGPGGNITWAFLLRRDFGAKVHVFPTPYISYKINFCHIRPSRYPPGKTTAARDFFALGVHGIVDDEFNRACMVFPRLLTLPFNILSTITKPIHWMCTNYIRGTRPLTAIRFLLGSLCRTSRDKISVVALPAMDVFCGYLMVMDLLSMLIHQVNRGVLRIFSAIMPHGSRTAAAITAFVFLMVQIQLVLLPVSVTTGRWMFNPLILLRPVSISSTHVAVLSSLLGMLGFSLPAVCAAEELTWATASRFNITPLIATRVFLCGVQFAMGLSVYSVLLGARFVLSKCVTGINQLVRLLQPMAGHPGDDAAASATAIAL